MGGQKLRKLGIAIGKALPGNMARMTPMIRHRTVGMTLVEMLVVMAVIILLAALLLPALRKSGSRKYITCISNLRQISLSFSLFANDHDNQFPAQVSTNQGGTKELLQPYGVVPQFIAISNILGTPRVLACYADTNRHRAIRFEELRRR